ncbi:Structural maintenance of chromosomes protein 2 [Pleurotus pulmonarius]|nr:Structural maintenance of chromosomes protein 2 [Pleurotus pulmonarius]
MRIEELILEGFKSYPVRTQITGWDPSFNAITGLNGSGKSNILDAICFVLGMTNMSQMRAQNQPDLIYKRGQAGIAKASVTIVFDNSDREKSPVGYEQFKQITVTRQIALPNVTKYLLNGHKAQQQAIHTLFQAVQLNINNPNFLIMQGKITKVLNMRPQEILGMVEEAAGTRMFEERKDKAQRTMAKKEKRVQEITSLLAEEISPKLEKLRHEKRSFIQYQKACDQLEHLGRVLRAWEWVTGNERIESKSREIAEKEALGKEIERDKKKYAKECAEADKAMQNVAKKRDEEMKKGGKLKKQEEEVAELDKLLVKLKTNVDIQNGNVKDEEERISTLEGELKELENSLVEKQKEVESISAAFKVVDDEHKSRQAKLTSAEELLQSLLTGLSSSNRNGGGGGYMGQLADAKARIAQAAAEEEQCRVKLVMHEKELKALEARWKSMEKEAKDGEKQLEKKRREVEEVAAKLAACGWDADKENEGETNLRRIQGELRGLKDQHDRLLSNLSQLAFNYTPPYPNFPTSAVLGPVASLISLPPEQHKKAFALEICAGGKLWQVVVEDERVGKEVLEKGNLRKRVTMIPLNRVRPMRLSAQKLQAANRLTPGKVDAALSLVNYSDRVEPAIAHVFSDNLICSDTATAKALTFNNAVGVRSVTLDGDVYDPSGTLTGGSAPASSNNILIRAGELAECKRKMEAKEEEFRVARDAWEGEAGRRKRDAWKALAREREMKEHEMKLLVEQVESSNAARLGTQIEELKQTILDLQNALQSANNIQKEGKEECKKLERDMAEFKDNKEGKIDELKADIAKQKSALQKHSVALKTQQKDLQTAKLELEQIEGDIEAAQAGIVEARAGVEKIQKELSKLDKEYKKTAALHAAAEEKLLEERATLSRFDNELKELDQVIKSKKEAISEADLQLKKTEHELQALAKEKAAATNKVADLEQQHPWIEEDKETFGKPGSPYDFKSMDMKQQREEARKLEEAQKGMKKKVNPKVLNMIDSVEKRETSLKKNLATVMKDKEKIEATIEELDRYKRDALQKTWEKVDGDFGGIFAELLPGNFAKLQPPDGQDLMDGLEVKVRLGSVWKQSLTELSGGQRSLIALSLIMALLQFKPAPMYILDEIDAALDLSHTQHIGQLFRTRFKGSQFIVVSLKEGLFTNANVLFRTRFNDGISIVERTAHRSTSALYNNGQEDENAGNGRRRRIAAAS